MGRDVKNFKTLLDFFIRACPATTLNQFKNLCYTKKLPEKF